MKSRINIIILFSTVSGVSILIIVGVAVVICFGILLIGLVHINRWALYKFTVLSILLSLCANCFITILLLLYGLISQVYTDIFYAVK